MLFPLGHVLIKTEKYCEDAFDGFSPTGATYDLCKLTPLIPTLPVELSWSSGSIPGPGDEYIMLPESSARCILYHGKWTKKSRKECILT